MLSAPICASYSLFILQQQQQQQQKNKWTFRSEICLPILYSLSLSRYIMRVPYAVRLFLSKSSLKSYDRISKWELLRIERMRYIYRTTVFATADKAIL